MKMPRLLFGAWLWIMGAVALAQDFDALKASIVKIVSTKGDGSRIGTGFVVKVDGDEAYIVTASGVIEGDREPKVYFIDRRSQPVVAQVVKVEGGDSRGLGLLRVEGVPKNVLALPVAVDLTPSDGEEAATIGFGEGQGDWAVIRVYVTSVDGRDIRLEGRIEDGNAGGPLLKQGRVVGLITDTRQGFGLASPGYILTGTLRGWKVDVGAAPVASNAKTLPERHNTADTTQGVSLQAKPPAIGRRARESSHFTLSAGELTVTVGAQAVRGTTTIERRQVIERTVLRIAEGRVSQERLHFVELGGQVTRDVGGDVETEPQPNTLQGKTVTGTRKGSVWQFKPQGGVLSAAELRDLQGHTQGADEGFPAKPVTIGQQWTVTGQALRNLMRLGNVTVTQGQAELSLEGVSECAPGRCADLAISIKVTGLVPEADGSRTTVSLQGQGSLRRLLDSDLIVEAHLDGHMTMTGTVTEQGVSMQVNIAGPFVYEGATQKQ